MLTETFVAATSTPDKISNTTVIGIHFHELQPLPALKSTFKKSSINPNCLAISPTHIFAAQADKAVIHVYNRERKNQECIIPFPERIRSIAITGEQNGGGFLIIGTEGGRLILWELCTGRQVSTPQHHLHGINCLAVDRTSNFILTSSADSNIHVWSLPALLSFDNSFNDNGQDLPLSPVRSLSNHRAAVTALAFGQIGGKNDIAVSVSRDETCVVWDYLTGMALHTFLLLSLPLCLALDPVDRAAYIGYEGGDVQLIDFYKEPSTRSQLHDPAMDAMPTQTPESDRLKLNGDKSDVLCIQVSYDGTLLLTGHENGKVNTWDVARGRYQRQIVDFSAPVTNLTMLRPTGFVNTKAPSIKLHRVNKPRYESFANASNGGARIPKNYKITAELTSNLPLSGIKPDDMFREAWKEACYSAEPLDDSDGEDITAMSDLRSENASLLKQLKEANDKIRERDREDWKRQQDDELKATRKRKRRLTQSQLDEIQRKQEMGEPIEDGEMEMKEGADKEGDLSSDTDEITDSD